MNNLHPVQVPVRRNYGGKISKKVTLRAYEVYSKVYAPQEAWRDRVQEAFEGMENI